MNAKRLFLSIMFGLVTACVGEKVEEISEPSTEEAVSVPSYAYITQNFSGSATVIPNSSYEGLEIISIGFNELAGTGNLQTELVWTVVGTAIPAPTECGADCVFAFDLNLTYDEAASTDPNGEGIDMNYSYALGVNSYGENTLFYGSEDLWSEWLVDGYVTPDLAGTEHRASINFDGTNFDYNDGFIDFYYYY